MTKSVRTPPVVLAGPALEKWQELSTEGDWQSNELAYLAAYCAAYGRWHSAETWLADSANGTVITIRDDKGNIKSHGPAPQLGIAERSQKEMARIAILLDL